MDSTWQIWEQELLYDCIPGLSENEDQAGTRSWRVLYIMLKCLYFTQKWLEDIEKVDALKSCDSNYTIELVDFFSAP